MKKTKSDELIIEQVKLFIEVLDFPRQEPDGYIMNDGEVTISAVILGSDYEPGYNIVHKNPSILKDPEIVKKNGGVLNRRHKHQYKKRYSFY